MITATPGHRLPRAAGSGYGFRTVAQMEWRKLRTVRSSWWIVAVFAASMIGLAILVLSHEGYARMSAADRGAFDPTHDCFIGLVLGPLLFGALGVLAITTEFSSGMIHATFAAVPSRPLVLTAKAAVLGSATLVTGEITAFAAFLAGQAALAVQAPHATLGQPGVLRAVLMAGVYPALIALIGLGIGAVIRHTAGALCALVGVLFVLPLLFISPSLQNESQNFLPHPMANSMTAVQPFPDALPSGLLLGLLCVYATVALAAGCWALARRDALAIVRFP
jgi:ABC-2 type transport system permease protein